MVQYSEYIVDEVVKFIKNDKISLYLTPSIFHIYLLNGK